MDLINFFLRTQESFQMNIYVIGWFYEIKTYFNVFCHMYL